MTQEEYQRAFVGLRTNPQRHYVIDGRQPGSLDELNDMAKKSGLKFTSEPVLAPAADGAVPTETTPPPTPPVDPVVPPAKPEEAPAADGAVPTETTPPPTPPVDGVKVVDGIEVPMNLGTLTYNQLRSLAASLKITPAPNTQPDLLAAITARRDA